MREIFVFGSNLAGRHGAGAALFARNHYGAEYGIGEGLTGDSYALPTKDAHIQTLPYHKIDKAIARFLAFAKEHPEMRFLLTPVGCGLAGYKRSTIWKSLKTHGMPSNVVLTSSWLDD